MWANNISYCTVPIFCYFFCIVLDMKVVGLAMARNLAEIIQFLFLKFYIKKKDIFRETYIPFTTKAFEGWGQYLKISIPIAAIIYLEWTIFEIQIVMAGNLTREELAGFANF